jgi:hypothetical protein
MATKAAYLTALGGLSYIQGVDTPIQNNGESNSNLSWTVYDVYLTELDGSGKGILIKHQFVVFDEGGGSEEVLNEYIPFYKENLTGYNAMITYIEGISALKSYWIRQISTEQSFAIIRAMIYVTDHIEIKWYLIYVDGELTHAEITNPEDF